MREATIRFTCSILFVFLFMSFSVNAIPSISQKRGPNETFQQALTRSQKNFLPFRQTPVKNRVPIDAIDYSTVPSVITYQELMDTYNLIRDSRFLATSDHLDFARRISWLYPDDGCFARAALGGIKADDAKIIRPVKIFAFGNLEVETPFSTEGFVRWWFHVALVIGYMGEYYVIDPAVDHHAPMLVSEWYRIMSLDGGYLSGVVCNRYAYSVDDDCFAATSESDEDAQSDEDFYLDAEWDRMVELGYDPYLILGDFPPWFVQLKG